MSIIKIMLCPNCKEKELRKTIFNKVEVDYCPFCLGVWFEEDELREAKDEKDKELNWLDLDLWKNKEDFKISQSPKICPKCSVPLYQVNYGNSDVEVDLCGLCRGIWLDRGEFKKIIDYLRMEGQSQIIEHYLKNLVKEGIEIFSGPEEFKSEVADFLTLAKLLNYKMTVQYPHLSRIISGL